MTRLHRRAYAEMYGPTTGDRVRLADTALVIEVEQDLTLAAGDGGHQASRRAAPREACAPPGGSDDTKCGAWGLIEFFLG